MIEQRETFFGRCRVDQCDDDVTRFKAIIGLWNADKSVPFHGSDQASASKW